MHENIFQKTFYCRRCNSEIIAARFVASIQNGVVSQSEVMFLVCKCGGVARYGGDEIKAVSQPKTVKANID